MSVLVILACFAAGKCERVYLPVEACTAFGQAAVARFVGENPGVTVKSWSCEPGVPT